MNDSIAVLSGLPESGVPLLRAKLEAAGMRCLAHSGAEWNRAADLQGDVALVSWQQLHSLPAGRHCRVVFLRRNLGEVVVARLARLAAHGADPLPGADRLLNRYQRYFRALCDWLKTQPNIEALHIGYDELARNTDAVVRRVLDFIDIERLPLIEVATTATAPST